MKIKYKSLAWEQARGKRIGSSEVFGLIQYYATDNELLNVGIDPIEFRRENAFYSAFFLYHKMIGTDGLKSESLPISLGEYGLASEAWAEHILKKQGITAESQAVYVTDRCIASCDLITPDGVVEIKTVNRFNRAEGMSWRTNIQHQYQMWVSGIHTGKIFEIVLKNDNTELRCWLAGLFAGSKKKFLKQMDIIALDFIYEDNYNPAFGVLFEAVMTRFLNDITNRNEPNISKIWAMDKKHILMDRVKSGLTVIDPIKYNLSDYVEKKSVYDVAKEQYDMAKSGIIDLMYMSDCDTMIDEASGLQLKIDSRGAVREKKIKIEK